MKPRALIFHGAMAILIIVLLLWQFGLFGSAAKEQVNYPTQAIKIVVPYPAGGGSDTFTRIIERAIVDDELLPVPIVIQNLGGGSGTIGSRDVLEAEPDGHTLLMHHHALLGVYVDEVADFGPDDFEVFARTGSMSMVIIVREDSEFESLTQLLEKAKANPNEVTFGANPGSQAYFTAKQLELSYPGARFAMVSADGGADRYARLIGGHLDAGIFALSEFLDFLSPEGTPADQNIRALVLMSPERHEAIPEVETSSEQGFDIFMENAYYWWAPKGTPQGIQDILSEMLAKAMQNERVLEELDRLKINSDYLQGEAMQDKLDAVLAEMNQAKRAAAAIEEQRGITDENVIPDIPLFVIIITALLLLGVIVQSWTGHFSPEDEPTGEEETGGPVVQHPALAGICFLIVVLYVLLLQLALVPWTILSTVMIFVIGGILSHWKPSRLLVVAELALVFSLGTAFLFTEVLTGVILP